MLDLYDYSLSAIFLAGLLLVLVASEIGRRIGSRASATGGGDISTLESAVLGLMALMIGFTFAMALSRFETRRDTVLNEANCLERSQRNRNNGIARSTSAATGAARGSEVVAGVRDGSTRHYQTAGISRGTRGRTRHACLAPAAIRPLLVPVEFCQAVRPAGFAA
jgi:hypothetical protein